jgi:hypothetical protein
MPKLSSPQAKFMSSLINQQSFIIGAILFLGLCAFVLLRDGPKRRDFFLLAGLALGLAAIWFAVRPTASPEANSEQVRAQIGAGTPVLLEFQSPY